MPGAYFHGRPGGEQNSVLAVQVADATGTLTRCSTGGSTSRGWSAAAGSGCTHVGIRNGRPVMINPVYELLG